MLTIDIRSNIAAVEKRLTALALTQVPIATAQAINDLANDVKAAEKQALPHIFDRPTPFTMNSIRIIPARKLSPMAVVFIMDTAAEYLYPYEVGGMSKLIGRGVTWLEPVDYSLLNQYGNFPVHTLERLVGSAYMTAKTGVPHLGRNVKGNMIAFPGKPGLFIGTVTSHGRSTGGVWKRVEKGGKQARGLKLLIRFGDEKPAKKHLDFGKRAQDVVRLNFGKHFYARLSIAVATMRTP